MSKRQNITYESKEENAFSLSTGDLMAGLLFIFILLLMGAMLQVQETADQLKERAEEDKRIVQRYDQIKTQLYIDFKEEFKEDLTVWRATIDSTLCIRFQEPAMLFDNNKAELKQQFKIILNDFFPRYIDLLSRPEYKESIVEIRIEGHTDSNGEYFHNMELSQNRTRTVLEYCFGLMSDEQINWAKALITANGLSSSQPIMKDGLEIKELSRRVEFRVRTNAEKHLEEIANKRTELSYE
ncbi:OmpA family protein [Parabacteroides distasonis]|nr:OmpA family protein [Parabacteroides distasonis]